MTERRKTAVLLSGNGSTFQSLADAAAADMAFPADIRLVISNTANAYGLERAQAAGIEALAIPHRGFPSRPAFEAAVHSALTERRIEFVCLAGFMRIFSAEFTPKWAGRMLNIHPSLLPAFGGYKAQEQVMESSVALSGCTVHAVTSALDGGPIVAQAAVPRFAGDDLAALTDRVRQAEIALYPFAVRAFLRGEGAVPDRPDLADAVFGVNAAVRYGCAG